MENLNTKSNVINIQDMVQDIVAKERKQYENPDELTLNESGSSFSSTYILDALKSNEDGDALLLINLQRNKFCYDHSDNQWFRWTGNYWEKDRIEEVLASIESIVQLYVREAGLRGSAKIGEAAKGNKDIASKIERIEKELLTRIHNIQSVKGG